MTETLAPYPDYRDSGAPWLGNVPAHWEVHPNRALFYEVKDIGHEEEPMLSVTMSRGVVTQERLLAASSKKDSSNLDRSRYKLVQPGDIAYNKMRAWQGALGVSKHRGIVSPAYVVVRPRREMDPSYYHHLMRTAGFAKEAGRWSYGITSDMWSLRYEDFKQIAGILPPIEEQRQIARYLDAQSARVDRLIRAKQRLVALLTEQKQAVIQRAVTRGLDPDAPMKPSGVDWLGDVPAYWNVIALRYLGTKFGSGVTPRGGAGVYTTTGVPLLRSQNVHFGGLRLDGVARIPPSVHASMRGSHVAPSDVLLNITGASIGRVCSVSTTAGPMNVNQHVCIIRPRHKQVRSEYLAYYLSSPSIQDEVMGNQGGASREALTLSDIKSMPVLVPPLEEQEALVAFIAERADDVQAAIDTAHREIALIREYRTRLVADVVTGKLDVRGATVPDMETTDLGTEAEETDALLLDDEKIQTEDA